MTTPRKRKPAPSFLTRMTHNWSWADSFFGGALGLSLGYLVGRGNHFDFTLAEQLEFNHTWLVLLIKLSAAGAFFGRAWGVAQLPRPGARVSWGRLDWKQMIVTFFRDNYIALVACIIALAFTFSAAPEGLAIFESVKPE